VPANLKVGLPDPARGPNFRENPREKLCRKKVEIQVFIEKIYRVGVFSFNIISS
jgi:hypothetical protein